MASLHEHTFWLTFKVRQKRDGFKSLTVRATESRPHLAIGEVPIQLTVKLPAALFDRPSLTAQITVPEDKIPEMQISSEVVNDMENLLSEQLGMVVRITADAPPEPRSAPDARD